MAAGTLLARDVVLKAQRLLNDLHGVNWGIDELVGWLNAGQRQVAILRPDASSEVVDVTLVAGTLQTAPAGTIRILDVIRNVGGRVITYIDRADLDGWDTSWHSATASEIAKHWMLDERVPDRFYVYPPQPASPGSIEIARSITPEDCTLADVDGESVDSVININDIFEGALIDYIVFRSYSKDAEYTVRGGKAEMSWNHFLQVLGLQLTTDRRFTPEVNTPPQQTATQPGKVGAFKS